MRIKPVRLVVLALALHIVPVASSAAELNLSALQFDAESKQCVPEPGDADVQFTFVCRNISTEAVSITGLHTSCGCTVAQLPVTPYTLKPGSNVSINVSMNIAGKNGLVTKSINVESTAGLKSLFVSANIPTQKVTDTK